MKLTVKKFNIGWIYASYANDKNRYNVGVEQFNRVFDKCLTNIDKLIDLIKCNNTKEMSLIEILNNICYFAIDYNDLIEIIEIRDKIRYDGFCTLNTTMGRDNVRYCYDILYRNCSNFDLSHNYSSLEIKRLIALRKIMLIKLRAINSIDNNMERYNYISTIVNKYMSEVFDGYYEELDYYIQNVNIGTADAIYKYILTNIHHSELLRLLYDYINVVNNILNYAVTRFEIFESTSEFAEIIYKDVINHGYFDKLAKIKKLHT